MRMRAVVWTTCRCAKTKVRIDPKSDIMPKRKEPSTKKASTEQR